MKDQLPENRQIYLSSINNPDLDRKLKLRPLSLLLHQRINLTNYGSSLRRYYCTFLALPPDAEPHPPFEDYEEEDKEADVAVIIPFEELKQATGKELYRLQETAFLQSIDALESLAIPEFDVAALRRDVEAIFAESRWYSGEEG